MNERIKELADQANEYALNKANEEDTEEDFDYSFDDDFKSKFAELIVQECAEFVEQDQGSGEVLSNRLKQYFGIEEPRGWICPKCGVDRCKESCPSGYNSLLTGQCPMVGVAQ